MRTITATALTIAFVAFAAPGAAQATELHAGPTGFAAKAPNALVGLTSQSPCEYGGPTCGVVNVTPHRNGRTIKQVMLGYEAECEVPDMVMDGVATAEGLKIKRAGNGSSFKAGRAYLADVGDGYTARVENRFTGKLDKRGRAASGTFSAVAVVMHEGRQVDRCATGRVSWKAQRIK